MISPGSSAGPPVLLRGDPAPNGSRPLPDGVTLGVEEEFLLVDRRSLRVVPRAEAVLAAVPGPLRDHVRGELLRTQVEIATPICHDLAGLRAHLVRLRRGLAAAAERAGCRLVAAGAGVLEAASGPTPSGAGPRAEAMRERFGAMVDTQGLSACHVHVGIGDLDLAVAVSNHVRLWLPVLQAMSANSPYVDGRDSGYASWRSVLWARRPTAGAPPWLRSAAHFHQLVEALLGSGAMLDRATLFWYARPSAGYPTIELRVGDVCASVDETVLIAALARALVRTAVRDVHAGPDAPCVDDQLLAAAHWSAARYGLEGELFDAATARSRPAWEAVDALVGHVAAVLVEDGDLQTVQSLCAAIRVSGAGAKRQRDVYRRRHDLRAVVRYLHDQTVPTHTTPTL